MQLKRIALRPFQWVLDLGFSIAIGKRLDKTIELDHRTLSFSNQEI